MKTTENKGMALQCDSKIVHGIYKIAHHKKVFIVTSLNSNMFMSLKNYDDTIPKNKNNGWQSSAGQGWSVLWEILYTTRPPSWRP